MHYIFVFLQIKINAVKKISIYTALYTYIFNYFKIHKNKDD